MIIYLNVARTLLIVLLSVLVCDAQSPIKITDKEDFSIGQSITVESNILSEDRTLNIYLPLSYTISSDKDYPVIYLLDGSADEDFIHMAGLIQFLSFSWINAIPETIIVGIANVDRKRDFTYPTTNERDKIQFPTAGSSDAFIRFIEKELKPTIESNYRIDTISTLIGQSLGGLLATEILFKKPQLFDNYVIVSPSLWWDDESLFQHIPSTLKGGRSVYIGVGKEGDVMEDVAYQLYASLIPFKSNGLKLFFDYIERLDHGDTLHLAAYYALEKIFAKQD